MSVTVKKQLINVDVSDGGWLIFDFPRIKTVEGDFLEINKSHSGILVWKFHLCCSKDIYSYSLDVAHCRVNYFVFYFKFL